MRIFNGTKKVLTLPYTGGETLTIPAHQPSGNILCSPEFLSAIITAYTVDELAIIASGPFEITACANIPTATQYVVQSLDEAISRFNLGSKEEKPEPKKEEPKEEPKKEEEPKEEPKKEEEPKMDDEKPEPEPEVVKASGKGKKAKKTEEKAD